MTLIPRGSFFDVDKFFDDFWSPARRGGNNIGAFFTPRVDIKELDDHYEITAELPGGDGPVRRKRHLAGDEQEAAGLNCWHIVRSGRARGR